MPAPLLRRVSLALTGTTATTVVSAVPASRALVVSKVVVAASGTANLTLTVGGTNIATGISMAAGEVYTESGIVLVAGDTLTATASVGNALTVSVYGEEVDN